MCQHHPKKRYVRKLIPHPNGRSQNWYIRLTVPKALQYLTSQKECRKSTGTADRYKAKKVAARIEAEKREEWEDLARIALLGNDNSRPTSLSSSLIQEICGIRISSWIKRDESERFGDDGIDDALRAEIDQFCQYTEAAMRSVLAQGKAGKRSSTWFWIGAPGHFNASRIFFKNS